MDDAHRQRHTASPARDSHRTQRSGRAPSQGPVKPFAWGFALGCLASGILAVVITGSPVPFVSGSAEKPAADTKASPQPSASAPKSSSGVATSSGGASSPTSSPSVAANAPGGLAGPPNAPAANTDPAKAKPAGFFVQTGAFKSRGEAEKQQAQLALAGFESSLVSLANDGIVRVRLGPYASAAKANQVRDQLSESGVQSTLVKP